MSPGNRAHFVYGIACDSGCIWDLKFCPSGAWEHPETLRKAPLLPRLGLLALACSDGKVLLFSLPHPEALLAQQPPDAMKPAIYKVSEEPVTILEAPSSKSLFLQILQ